MRGIFQLWALFILADGIVALACGLKLLVEWYDTGVSFKARDIGLMVLFLVSLGCAIEAFVWFWGQQYITDLPKSDEAKVALVKYVYVQAISRTFAAIPRYMWAMYLFRIPPFRTRPAAVAPATGGPPNPTGPLALPETTELPPSAD